MDDKTPKPSITDDWMLFIVTPAEFKILEEAVDMLVWEKQTSLLPLQRETKELGVLLSKLRKLL
jgi:hypothetical protein